jgi:hypothetical protein
VARLPLLYAFAKTATPDLTPFERSVLGVYLAYADLHDGRGAYPSAQTIADALEYIGEVGRRPNRRTVPRKPHVKTVKHARYQLRDIGYLEWTGRHTPTINGVERGDKSTPIFTARITPSGGAPALPGDFDQDTERGSAGGPSGGVPALPKAVPALRKHSSNALNDRAGRSEIANGGGRDTAQNIGEVLAHFVATRARYGETATATPRRHRVAGLALRTFTVAQVTNRIDELHEEYDFTEDGDEIHRAGRYRCDLHNVLEDLADYPPTTN